ncbi:MAG: hypothetical protein ACI4EA_12475 [Candidatus Ornithomonoglobus sp.]
MKSRWKITSQYIDDEKKIYQVYRTIDLRKTDHSGNREYVPGIFTNREDAVELADKLNKAE